MKPLLADKTILIVEDYPAMRKAIRNMLYTLNAEAIDEADDAESALNALRKKNFDIVLCDHNLGTGKNGQHVLEEARFAKLIGPHCIFIIIAAEQTASGVLGAMDSKPDEYLTKPFNAQQLFVRLERNLTRKALVQTIEKDIERGNLSQAIQQCERLLSGDNKKVRMHLLRMRAELATLVGDFETGKKIYTDIVHERDLPWARLGLGIIDFQQGEIEQAATTFEALLRDHPLFLEGYDWLAKTYETQDKMQEVQDVMHQAVDLSPQSILRQKRLAQTADKNGNSEVAEKAYQAAISLGKYSIYKSCSDFSNLSKLYSKIQADEKALETLARMRKEYINDPEAELRATVLEAALHKNRGNSEEAAAALQKALVLSKQIGSKCPKDVRLDLARTCFLHDRAADADAILQEAIKTHVDDDAFLADMRQMQAEIGLENRSEDFILATKRELVATNNQGVSLYKQGKFDEAMTLFEKAIASMPDNQTIIINMLKITLHDLKTADFEQAKLIRAQALLKKARLIGVDPHKLGVLQMEFSHLMRQYNEAKA